MKLNAMTLLGFDCYKGSDGLSYINENGKGRLPTTTESQLIDAEEARLIAERDTTEYQRKRREEYPSIESVVVALIEDKEGRPEALAEIMASRADVKAKYKKPTVK